MRGLSWPPITIPAIFTRSSSDHGPAAAHPRGGRARRAPRHSYFAAPGATARCSQTALDAGISPETLRKIESGRVWPTPAFPTIAAIADVLGLSLDTLWTEVNQPEPNRLVS